jgi:hypothetical protein
LVVRGVPFFFGGKKDHEVAQQSQKLSSRQSLDKFEIDFKVKRRREFAWLAASARRAVLTI